MKIEYWTSRALKGRGIECYVFSNGNQVLCSAVGKTEKEAFKNVVAEVLERKKELNKELNEILRFMATKNTIKSVRVNS